MSDIKLNTRSVYLGNKPTRITRDLGNGCRVIIITPARSQKSSTVVLRGVYYA